MKSLILNWAMMMPFTLPATRPIATATRMHTISGMPRANIEPKLTAAKVTTAAFDKSMPAVITTKAWPMTKIAGTAEAVRIVEML